MVRGAAGRCGAVFGVRRLAGGGAPVKWSDMLADLGDGGASVGGGAGGEWRLKT